MKVDISTLVLYGVALAWLLFSFAKDKAKTVLALKKAWRSFLGILPPLLTVIFLISLVIVFYLQGVYSHFFRRTKRHSWLFDCFLSRSYNPYSGICSFSYG